ncbi:MAG: hypothetical protein M1374_02665 [Firmicutes bacterium]|jgi:hypothetical protein|nr:hypothetical protein [Bacillota bacterium]
MQLILLLLVVWTIALAPYIWKKVNQFRIDSEIGKFGSSISLIANHGYDISNHNFSVYPDSPDAHQGNSHKVHPESNLFYLPGYEYLQYNTSAAKQMTDTPLTGLYGRKHSQVNTRHRQNRKVAIRKRNLKILLVSVLFTLTFGAIPVFNFLWYICILCVISTAAYIGVLYYLNNNRSNTSVNRHSNLTPKSQVIPSNRANGRSESQALFVQELKRKPSFVIVDDPEIRRRALP